MAEHKHPGNNLLYKYDEPIDPSDLLIKVHKTPEASEWKLYLFGKPGEGYNTVFHPRKGQEKNWFQRKMMELFFGVKWVK